MRDIKFRAWDKEENAWFKWNFYVQDGEIMCADETILTIGEDVEVMQFTGLLDKNGKEIWEGDIVRDNKDGAIGLVIYTPPIFSVKLKEKLNEEEYWNLGAGKVYPDNYKLIDTEVIGNIHENPELLKGE